MSYFKSIIIGIFAFIFLNGCSQKELDTATDKINGTFKTLWANFTYLPPDNNAVYSPDKPVLLIVLDASGSMNDRDRNGVVKIKAAKDVISDIVGQIDPLKTNVGLIAFNDGCNSTKLLVDPTNNDPYTVNAVVQTMKASSGTPLANSIKKAGEVLSQTNQKVNVLIISDGDESCGGDPVYEAQQLMVKYGVEPTMYVVGYNVDSRSKQQLQLISKVGKGGYFDVQDSEILGKMLNQIIATTHVKNENFSDDGNIYNFNINFSSDSDVIQVQYLKNIEDLAKYLYTNKYSATIEGYTDNVGSKQYNKDLSNKRAKAVMNKLIEFGIEPSKLNYIGYGDEKPLASNKTEDGKFKNRRVEAHIKK
ncbi:OmpA family protein [Aliarcobacter cryaerophilus]|uniref:OmpA family protein n=1 Tax=Aliarcobacter cryaerophilus TaxID=28198 RepID=UPI0021B242A3|nr:OmpA family protein [Aliarcobacter cryaerophilus]MCT7464706.1 OmpA family protein [Aliarcobacter cryaerophilus]